MFFETNNGNRAKSKFFISVVSKCLINGKGNQTILTICGIPVLHEMESLANHILYYGLHPTFGKEVVDNLLKDLGIKDNYFYGKSLNGNNSKKLLDKADDLLADVDEDSMLLLKL